MLVDRLLKLLRRKRFGTLPDAAAHALQGLGVNHKVEFLPQAGRQRLHGRRQLLLEQLGLDYQLYDRERDRHFGCYLVHAELVVEEHRLRELAWCQRKDLLLQDAWVQLVLDQVAASL